MRRFLIVCISFILCTQLLSCSAFESDKTTMPLDSTHSPQKIAVLLPLQGKYGDSAAAIRNGFMAAYYADKEQQNSVPAVKVIDTSGKNIKAVYEQAVSDGADMVVGPLDKEQVQTLVQATKLTVPTLALNSVTTQKIPNLVQFALSQTDEANQIALRAHQEGHQRAIIIAPAGNWGNGIADAFKQRWQNEGGEIADQLGYLNFKQLPEQIRQILGAQKSQPRKSKSKNNTQDKNESQARRRQDFDMIFLVAEPDRAREIVPLLKFYYAGNVPIYATSAIYSGRSSSTQDNDLDNIQFSDMPWVLGGLSDRMKSIQQNVSELWKNSYSQNPKLYALGVDAYQLSTQMNELKSSPQNRIRGATGQLSLSENNQIVRELRFAKIRGQNTSILQ